LNTPIHKFLSMPGADLFSEWSIWKPVIGDPSW
jgi:hypothetical protein